MKVCCSDSMSTHYVHVNIIKSFIVLGSEIVDGSDTCHKAS
jgi:hypothetical protein